MIKNIRRRLVRSIQKVLFLDELLALNKERKLIELSSYLKANLFNNPRYTQTSRLNRFEFQAFSQFGEDGIIREIFSRIGVTNKYFVEFGVETGIETNTTYLLYQDWQGLWIDGGESNINSIKNGFRKKLGEGSLKVVCEFINAENIQSIFESSNVPLEPDLLSIDIDRNDYYVWKAITNYKPRVVVIEYNAIFRPGVHYKVDYDPVKTWDGGSSFGASLEELVTLGAEKGYTLVACSFAGVNAFFVRNDLIKGYFEGPFTTDYLYEEPRYYLFGKTGHPRKVDF